MICQYFWVAERKCRHFTWAGNEVQSLFQNGQYNITRILISYITDYRYYHYINNNTNIAIII